jgi:hypothetical protein
VALEFCVGGKDMTNKSERLGMMVFGAGVWVGKGNIMEFLMLGM